MAAGQPEPATQEITVRRPRNGERSSHDRTSRPNGVGYRHEQIVESSVLSHDDLVVAEDLRDSSIVVFAPSILDSVRELERAHVRHDVDGLPDPFTGRRDLEERGTQMKIDEDARQRLRQDGVRAQGSSRGSAWSGASLRLAHVLCDDTGQAEKSGRPIPIATIAETCTESPIPAATLPP